jgi:hypothetical protein
MLRILHLVVIALVWAGFVYQTIRLKRRPGDPTRFVLSMALLFYAMAFTIGLPPLYQRLPWFAESPSLVRLVQHAMVVLGVFWTQTLGVHLTTPSDQAAAKIRRRAVTIAVFLTAMIVLFVLAAPGDDSEDFVKAYAQWPFVTEYLLTFLSCLALALADIFRLTVRFAGRATEKPLRAGLLLWSAASVAGFLFAVHKAGYALVMRLGGQPPWSEGPVSTTLSGIGMALFVVGLTTYSWGTRIRAARRLWRQYRSYRALLPLWRAFCEVMPDIALIQPRRGLSLGGWRTLELRLYRCVIEILDGRLALRSYWDDDVAAAAQAKGTAAGLTGPDLDAVVEAASLAAALDAKKRGKTTGKQPPMIAGVHEAGMPGEIERLTRVADAYRRSPIVAAVRSPRAAAAADLPAGAPG